MRWIRLVILVGLVALLAGCSAPWVPTPTPLREPVTPTATPTPLVLCCGPTPTRVPTATAPGGATARATATGAPPTVAPPHIVVTPATTPAPPAGQGPPVGAPPGVAFTPTPIAALAGLPRWHGVVYPAAWQGLGEDRPAQTGNGLCDAITFMSAEGPDVSGPWFAAMWAADGLVRIAPPARASVPEGYSGWTRPGSTEQFGVLLTPTQFHTTGPLPTAYYRVDIQRCPS